MPVKRNRRLRSSSQGELSVLDRQPSPPFRLPAAANLPHLSVPAPAKPSPPVRKRGPKSIFELSSPSSEPPSPSVLEVDTRFGGFLEHSRLCSKPMSSDDNVYMYRSAYAFCSLDCRAKQIARDEKMEKTSEKSTKITRNWWIKR